MLILTRNKKESLLIDEKVKLTVIDVRAGQVRLGIEAPSYMEVHREEIYRKNKMRTKGKTDSQANSIGHGKKVSGGLSESKQTTKEVVLNLAKDMSSVSKVTNRDLKIIRKKRKLIPQQGTIPKEEVVY